MHLERRVCAKRYRGDLALLPVTPELLAFVDQMPPLQSVYTLVLGVALQYLHGDRPLSPCFLHPQNFALHIRLFELEFLACADKLPPPLFGLGGRGGFRVIFVVVGACVGSVEAVLDVTLVIEAIVVVLIDRHLQSVGIDLVLLEVILEVLALRLQLRYLLN